MVVAVVYLKFNKSVQFINKEPTEDLDEMLFFLKTRRENKIPR